MPLGLSISGASQEEDALAGGGQLGKLVEGVAGALGGLDSVPCGLGELKGDDLESLGNIEEPDVVGDGANNCDNASELVIFGLGVPVVGEVLGDSGDGEGVSIESRLVEPLVDDLVELGIGSAGKEGIELTKTTGTLISPFR